MNESVWGIFSSCKILSVSASPCKQNNIIMAELPESICLFCCSSSNSVIRYNIVKCHWAALTFLQGRVKFPPLTHLSFFSVWRMCEEWWRDRRERHREGKGWGRINLGLTEAWWEKTEGTIMKENKPYWSTGLEDKEVNEWERKNGGNSKKNNHPHTGKMKENNW